MGESIEQKIERSKDEIIKDMYTSLNSLGYIVDIGSRQGSDRLTDDMRKELNKLIESLEQNVGELEK